MFKVVLRHAKEYRLPSILSPIFMALEVLMQVLIPYITAFIIDRGISANNMGNVYKYGLTMIGMAMLAMVFGSLSGIFAAKASTGFAKNLRKAMYEKIQTFSFSNIDHFSTAGLVTRMTTDITNIQNAYQMVIRIAIRAPITMIVSVIMCIKISAKISGMFFGVLVIIAVLAGALMAITVPIFKKVFKKYDALNASVQENLSGIRVVKAFVREDFEKTKFYKAVDDVYRLFVKAESRMAAMMPGMMIIIYTVIMMICWFGAHYIVAGDMTTGNLTSLYTYIMNVLMSMMMVAMVFVMITMSSASVNRIGQVLTEEPDIENPENPVMEVPNGDIRFDNVSFSYKYDLAKIEEEEKNRKKGPMRRRKKTEVLEEKNDAPKAKTLEGISLDIKSGETIGLIGGTGCGKSTFVSLISRLYDVDEGAVFVGDHNVKEYDLDTLRNEVSVVLQKNELFTGTILENLRWGKEDATLEECIHACEMACADEFIRNMPDGYETKIEQGGSNVSGGQKQRLCIARALLKNPKVLILDDSTSAVDTATDAGIRKAFRENIPGTTKIIISQRISSISDADKIIVMGRGTVEGFGTHEELMQTNDIYKEIYETQTRGSGDFDQQ